MGLFISVVTIFLPDIEQLLGIFLMFWFWATPIFYAVKMIPNDYQWIIRLNIVSHYIMAYRDILFWGKAPTVGDWFSMFLLSVVALGTGLLLFWILEPKIIKQI